MNNLKLNAYNKILKKFMDKCFIVLGLLSCLFGIIILGILIFSIFVDALPRLNINFLTSFPSRKPEQAGILSAWVGTTWIIIFTIIISIPLGISSGIYLEEYAEKNFLTDFIEINIANLAGVPSIIYGLLGLGLFVQIFKLENSILAGSLTLVLLILPMIIVSTREALRAVPFSIREASYALGASRWQTIKYQILPAAMGNIFTGIILGISRAIGETAPLITIGALTYIAFLPQTPVIFTNTFPFINFSLNGLFDSFTVLPIQIFNWISRPQKGFYNNAAAGIIVLLCISVLLNSIAIILRYKYQKRIKW